ncbi:MAG: SpoIVB peptidase S55 domain-containing protein [Bacilli bacterium]
MKRMYLSLMALVIMLLPLDVMAYSKYVIPGGENIGIEVHNNGVMVVGFYKVNGKYINSFLEPGDSIIKVNNNEINSINDLVNSIDKNIKNDKVNITYLRENKEYNDEINVNLFDGVYKTGLYVKDSLNGIGTITYIDPETKVFGALGHEILESTTNKRIEVKTGTIFDSFVLNINKSLDGNPGSKRAKISFDNNLGTVFKNTGFGIFGIYQDTLPAKDVLEIADVSEVSLGKASIYTVLQGKEIKEYEIDIKRIDVKNKIKNFYFEVTDEELLSTTGGIVQGMSGSPIIQNNKIIGAVTHVIIDDVKTGYGISIVTMLEEGEK